MNTAMHKNVIICNLILQSISFENALSKNILNVHWSVMRGKTNLYKDLY